MSGRNWTPYQIEIILHHYASLDRFPRWTAPAYEPTVFDLTRAGLLEVRDEKIRTTEKGDMLVELILQTPLPLQVWLDPRDHKHIVKENA